MEFETHLSQEWNQTFEAIRSFSDSEVSAALSAFSSNPQVIQSLFAHLPNAPDSASIISELSGIDTVDAFQDWLKRTISPLVEQSVTALTTSGLDKLSKQQGHIFVSNHHDIIMDPIVVNLALLENGYQSAHCAIGDNLLFSESATTLAKLNKCFRVMRSLSSPKALLKAMRVQANYIQHLHFHQHANIWIAQKEGRSKDKVDLTNPALIKMLCLAKPKEMNPNDYLATLNIVPVSISYEWDPCDIEKARQLEQEAKSGGYTKSNQEDLGAIKDGLLGFNGRIHVAFGKIIHSVDGAQLNRYETANQIDSFIHRHYQCFPSNLAAMQLLGRPLPDDQNVAPNAEIEAAEKELRARTAQCSKEIQNRVFKAYAQPVIAKYGLDNGL